MHNGLCDCGCRDLHAELRSRTSARAYACSAAAAMMEAIYVPSTGRIRPTQIRAFAMLWTCSAPSMCQALKFPDGTCRKILLKLPCMWLPYAGSRLIGFCIGRSSPVHVASVIIWLSFRPIVRDFAEREC